MAVPTGFNYMKGSLVIQEFNVASGAVFRAREPVSVDGAGELVGFDLGKGVAGIATSNSTDSIYTDRAEVIVPQPDTVFLATANAAATSNLTAFQSYSLETTATGLLNWVIDDDSTVTKFVRVVPRGGAVTDALSADSSVACQFLAGILMPMGSVGTSTNFA